MIRVMIVEDDPATGTLLRQLVRRIWPSAVVTLDADPLLALDRLPTGTVRKEPIIMRITALLHAGDPQHELPRLMARFGLSGKIDAVSTGSES